MTFVHYEGDLWPLVNRLHRPFRGHPDNNVRPTAAASQVSWVPRVDVYEEPQRFVVLADVPGIDPKSIDITAEKGVLTIRGERPPVNKPSDVAYERVERPTGTFVRQFTLPKGSDTESITAKQANGVLEISIPKLPQTQPRRVSVEAA